MSRARRCSLVYACPTLVFWFSFVCHLVALILSSPERLPRRAARGLGARSPHLIRPLRGQRSRLRRRLLNQAEFTIRSPQANTIGSVLLMRCGSSTHAFNVDQRAVYLLFRCSDRVRQMGLGRQVLTPFPLR